MGHSCTEENITKRDSMHLIRVCNLLRYLQDIYIYAADQLCCKYVITLIVYRPKGVYIIIVLDELHRNHFLHASNAAHHYIFHLAIFQFVFQAFDSFSEGSWTW